MSEDLISVEGLQSALVECLSSIDDMDQKVAAINALKTCLHDLGPFGAEPVDCVLWVKASHVQANDYNPNVMAPVEKKLLKLSLEADGFTQPVVVARESGCYRVVDGFHRQVLGSVADSLGRRLKGYLPVALVNSAREGKAERIASTIRHNRARGKHHIDLMSDIVRDLARLGWEDGKIARELGMDKDEVLRLKQITGLAELFASEEFSRAWTVL